MDLCTGISLLRWKQRSVQHAILSHWSFGSLKMQNKPGCHSLTVPASMSSSRARSELQQFKEWPTNTTQPETFKMTQTLNWIASIYTTFSVEALDVNLLRFFFGWYNCKFHNQEVRCQIWPSDVHNWFQRRFRGWWEDSAKSKEK